MEITREKSRALLGNFFDEKFVKNIEASTFNWCLKQADDKKIPKVWEKISIFYTRKMRSLLYNFRTCTELVENIKNKRIKIRPLPFLEHHELRPEGPLAHTINKMKDRQDKLDMLKKLDEADEYTGMYTCRDCKSKRTVCKSVQTRSADEPMTNFITCLDCEKRWKD